MWYIRIFVAIYMCYTRVYMCIEDTTMSEWENRLLPEHVKPQIYMKHRIYVVTLTYIRNPTYMLSLSHRYTWCKVWYIRIFVAIYMWYTRIYMCSISVLLLMGLIEEWENRLLRACVPRTCNPNLLNHES